MVNGKNIGNMIMTKKLICAVVLLLLTSCTAADVPQTEQQTNDVRETDITETAPAENDSLSSETVPNTALTQAELLTEQLVNHVMTPEWLEQDYTYTEWDYHYMIVTMTHYIEMPEYPYYSYLEIIGDYEYLQIPLACVRSCMRDIFNEDEWYKLSPEAYSAGQSLFDEESEYYTVPLQAGIHTTVFTHENLKTHFDENKVYVELDLVNSKLYEFEELHYGRYRFIFTWETDANGNGSLKFSGLEKIPDAPHVSENLTAELFMPIRNYMNLLTDYVHKPYEIGDSLEDCNILYLCAVICACMDPDAPVYADFTVEGYGITIAKSELEHLAACLFGDNVDLTDYHDTFSGDCDKYYEDTDQYTFATGRDYWNGDNSIIASGSLVIHEDDTAVTVEVSVGHYSSIGAPADPDSFRDYVYYFEKVESRGIGYLRLISIEEIPSAESAYTELRWNGTDYIIFEDCEPPIPKEIFDGSAPDFLTEEQRNLYKRAYTLYSALFGYNTSAVHEFPDNRYDKWDDFSKAVHSVFTEEFFESKNTYGNGLKRYSEAGGLLSSANIGKVPVDNYAPAFTDDFVLISSTDDEVEFAVIGHFLHMEPYNYETEHSHQERLQNSYDYSAVFTVRMIRTEDGWLIDDFGIPCIDGAEEYFRKREDTAAALTDHMINYLVTADSDGVIFADDTDIVSVLLSLNAYRENENHPYYLKSSYIEINGEPYISIPVDTAGKFIIAVFGSELSDYDEELSGYFNEESESYLIPIATEAQSLYEYKNPLVFSIMDYWKNEYNIYTEVSVYCRETEECLGRFRFRYTEQSQFMNRVDDDYIFLEEITLLTREVAGDDYEVIYSNGMEYVRAESAEALIPFGNYISEVPDFLSEEQAYLLKAASVLKDISDTPVHIDDYPRFDGQDYKHGAEALTTEINGKYYFKAAGRYERWDDFEKLYSSVFTDSRADALISDRFLNVEGDLYFSASAFNLHSYSYETDHTFTLVSESDTEIIIDIAVKAYHTPEPTERDEYEEVHYTVEFVLTDTGWRVY